MKNFKILILMFLIIVASCNKQKYGTSVYYETDNQVFSTLTEECNLYATGAYNEAGVLAKYVYAFNTSILYFELYDTSLGEKCLFNIPNDIKYMKCGINNKVYYFISGSIFFNKNGTFSMDKKTSNVDVTGEFYGIAVETDITYPYGDDNSDTIEIKNGRFEFKNVSYGETHQ